MTPDDLIGQRLPGGLLVFDYVAAGGFAWVFEAFTPERMRCAIKVPHVVTEDALKRFDREIKVLRELPPNPHCVGYVGHGRLPNGLPYLAMEFVDGVTLAQALESRPHWDVLHACALVTQLCSALRGMHRLGLANRDVTPGNVMLAGGRHVKLMDFGLVKDAQGLLHLLEEQDILEGREFAENLDKGLLVGTLDYAAPEQLADSEVVREELAQTDTWSDVYSVGLILYRMLTGEKLFHLDVANVSATTYARRVLDYLAMRTIFDETNLRRPFHVPEALWQILMRSLHRDPRRRQRTAMELGQELQRFLQTGDVEEKEDERTEAVDLNVFMSFLQKNRPPSIAPGAPLSERAAARLSSIPVVLDFDDDPPPVPPIPPHDRAPVWDDVEDKQTLVYQPATRPPEAYEDLDEEGDADLFTQRGRAFDPFGDP